MPISSCVPCHDTGQCAKSAGDDHGPAVADLEASAVDARILRCRTRTLLPPSTARRSSPMPDGADEIDAVRIARERSNIPAFPTPSSVRTMIWPGREAAASVDLIGQLGDPNHLEKSQCAVLNLKINKQLGYDTPGHWPISIRSSTGRTSRQDPDRDPLSQCHVQRAAVGSPTLWQCFLRRARLELLCPHRDPRRSVQRIELMAEARRERSSGAAGHVRARWAVIFQPIRGGVSGAFLDRRFPDVHDPQGLRIELYASLCTTAKRQVSYVCMPRRLQGAAPPVHIITAIRRPVATANFVSSRPLSEHPGGPAGLARGSARPFPAVVRDGYAVSDIWLLPGGIRRMLAGLSKSNFFTRRTTGPARGGLGNGIFAALSGYILTVSCHNDPIHAISRVRRRTVVDRLGAGVP